MTYTTKQQQAVLRCLEGHAAPMSAADLAEALRTEGSPVGLATIYRQLDKLEQQGRIHRVSTEGGAVYQYCSQDGHGDCFLLKCLDCGRILHLDCSRLQTLYRHFEDHHHFVIDPRATVFSGWCNRCADRRKETT